MTNILERAIEEVRALLEQPETYDRFARLVELMSEAYSVDAASAEHWMPDILRKLEGWTYAPGTGPAAAWNHRRVKKDQGAWPAIQRDHGWLQMIRALELGPRTFDLAEMKTLGSSTRLSQLRALSLRSSHLDSKKLKVLLRPNTFENLTHLNLHNNAIRVSGWKALAKASFFENLTHLNLGRNDIGDREFQALFERVTVSQLEHLGLGNNELEDASAEWLAQNIDKFPSLKSLDMTRNLFSSNGWEALLRCPDLSKDIKEEIRAYPGSS